MLLGHLTRLVTVVSSLRLPSPVCYMDPFRLHIRAQAVRRLAANNRSFRDAFIRDSSYRTSAHRGPNVSLEGFPISTEIFGSFFV